MLQQDLDTLTIFAETWQMQFNINETRMFYPPVSKHHHKIYFHILHTYVRQAPQDHQTTLFFI